MPRKIIMTSEICSADYADEKPRITVEIEPDEDGKSGRIDIVDTERNRITLSLADFDKVMSEVATYRRIQQAADDARVFPLAGVIPVAVKGEG